MTRPLRGLFGLAMVCAALAASPALAADRCTAQQRTQADRQLWLNARDRSLATRQVFPWGEPVDRRPVEGERRLVQRDYVIAYDDDLFGPVWVGEAIGLKPLRGGRLDCFRADPRIPGAYASRPSDYDEPIFDQGHMAPNADMTFGDIPIMNTFMMSNMSPQFCQFNRGIWQILETLVRFWAEEGAPVYILNGAVFDRDGDGARDPDARAVRMRSRGGATRVGVPTAYFKVLARQGANGLVETLTLLLPHTQIDLDGEAAIDYLRGHIVTVDTVESLSDLDVLGEAAVLVESRDLWPVEGASFRSLVAAPCRRTDGAVIIDGAPSAYALPQS